MKVAAIVVLLIGLVVLLTFVLRQGSKTLEATQDPARLPASESSDWINVRVGGPDRVRAAVESYDQLNRDQVFREFVVVLSTIQDGTVALTFLDKIPPYSFLNLVGWLHAPPDVEGVTQTTGWYSSPSSGIRYSLWPDDSNPHGDTLIGLSSSGDPVSVYQPDISFCSITRPIVNRPEPPLEAMKEVTRIQFAVPLEVLEEFGNPTLEFAHPPDAVWY